jgi:hypothetical protein
METPANPGNETESLTQKALAVYHRL